MPFSSPRRGGGLAETCGLAHSAMKAMKQASSLLSPRLNLGVQVFCRQPPDIPRKELGHTLPHLPVGIVRWVTAHLLQTWGTRPASELAFQWGTNSTLSLLPFLSIFSLPPSCSSSSSSHPLLPSPFSSLSFPLFLFLLPLPTSLLLSNQKAAPKPCPSPETVA